MPVDAYGTKLPEQNLPTPELDQEKDTIGLLKSWQIQRELRKATAFARKRLSETYQLEYLNLVESKLKLRKLSDESIETAMLTVKKSLRR